MDSAHVEAPGNGSPDTPLVLELKNVGVCYRRKRGLFTRRADGFWAIQDLSLQLHEGETLGIIGRNGAGKSTLLRLLAGITRPDRGSYVNHGYKATLLSLQVGFVQHLSGRENVMLSGLLLGLDRHEIERRMDDIIAFSELGEFIDQPIQTYSSGMRARLGFSTAFYVDPDILLIDEVLGVGDAAFVEKSKRVMREKINSRSTVVMVSHSASALRSLCDRVVWVERGRVKMEGRTAEVLSEYASSVRKSAPSGVEVSAASAAQQVGVETARKAAEVPTAAQEPPPPEEQEGRLRALLGEVGATDELARVEREEGLEAALLRLRRAQREAPPALYLPPPVDEMAGDARELAKIVLEEGYRWGEYPAFPVKPPLDWAADPHGDRTWRYLISSWSFLIPVVEAWKRSGDGELIAFAHRVVLDWIANVRQQEGGNDFVDYDMAVGLRASILAVVVDRALRDDTVVDEEVLALLTEARRHIDVLANPKRLVRYSNHGLFQLSGLLALVVSLEVFDPRGKIAAYAREHLESLFKAQFTREGIHREHSPEYHVALVRQLGQLLDSGWLQEAEVLAELHGQGQEAVAWMVHGDGSLARFGDTDLASPQLSLAHCSAGVGNGPRVYLDSGYAAYRRAGEGGGEGSLLALTAWFHGPAHKHADDLTFEWSAAGRMLIIDSGKYAYQYDDPRRRYAESTRAHNTVEIDGDDYPRDSEAEFGSALLAAGGGDGGWAVAAQIERPDFDLVQRRIWVYRPGRWLVVVDRLTGSQERRFTQWFHLHPDLRLELGAGGGEASTVADPAHGDRPLAILPLPVAGAPAPEMVHARGEESPRWQGWTSLRRNSLVANDALGYSNTGVMGTFVTLLHLGEASPTAFEEARVTEEGAEVNWLLDGHREGFSVAVSPGVLELSLS